MLMYGKTKTICKVKKKIIIKELGLRKGEDSLSDCDFSER